MKRGGAEEHIIGLLMDRILTERIKASMATGKSSVATVLRFGVAITPDDLNIVGEEVHNKFWMDVRKELHELVNTRMLEYHARYLMVDGRGFSVESDARTIMKEDGKEVETHENIPTEFIVSGGAEEN